MNIDEFYREKNLIKTKCSTQKQKGSIMNEIMKNPLTAMKFNELKKKIQLTIHAGEKALSIDKK